MSMISWVSLVFKQGFVSLDSYKWIQRNLIRIRDPIDV